jgi:proteasome accessory factor C
MSVGDRLGRLLFIVPYVADRDGVAIAELAEKTGATRAQIRADLDLLSMVGQPPLTPDHLIDLYVEDDVVYVDLDQSLSRPLRLTHEEARALVLGAKLVGELGGVGRDLEGALARIVELLNPVDREILQSLSARVGIGHDTADRFEPVRDLRRAIESSVEVELDYYSVSSDRNKTYTLRPLALLAHTGAEYLVALDLEAQDQEKLFRLDRMSKVRVTERGFEPPADLDLERFRTQRLYSGDEREGPSVRFSPRVARQVRERFAESGLETELDGSIRVRLATSSPAWLARWVLPFGADAEVLGSERDREYLAQLCREAAAAYDEAVG